MKALHSAKPMKKQDCGLSCLFAVFIGFAFALSFFSFSNAVQFAQMGSGTIARVGWYHSAGLKDGQRSENIRGKL